MPGRARLVRGPRGPTVHNPTVEAVREESDGEEFAIIVELPKFHPYYLFTFVLLLTFYNIILAIVSKLLDTLSR